MLFWAIVGILTAHTFLTVGVDYLNLTHVKEELPQEMLGVYPSDEYQKSQKYLRVQTTFNIFQSLYLWVLTLGFIAYGGFNTLDAFARTWAEGLLAHATLFLGALAFLYFALQLPFNLYHTFVIEQGFGFNQTNLSTYLLDTLKKGFLFCLFALPLFGSITWLFEHFPKQGWWGAFVLSAIFQLAMMYLQVGIMSWFNSFTPIEEGELKKAITAYAKQESFPLKGIFTMDGSKRSSKSNAFFSGFGNHRRIVLFDTLIEKHSKEELVAIIAHEMGHYKHKHLPKLLVLSWLQSFLMFYLLSFFIKNPLLFEAFSMEKISTYASLIFFTFLYTPISFFFSVFTFTALRQFEYQADAYASKSYPVKGALIDALKKLSVSNLSNLTPHPWKVFLEYSHPTVLQRIQALKG